MDDGRLRARVAAGGWLGGVDGGAQRLQEMGLIPDFVSGDFDSLTEDARAALAAAGAEIVPTPDQNFTDLDKALAYATESLGAREVFVWGATGGRLDHTCANLSALIKHGRRADIRLVDDIGETRLVNGEAHLSGPELIGRTLSLIALGPVEGIWSEGVRWPLRGEGLAPGVRDGTSNEIVAQTVRVRVGAGDLLLMLHLAR